MDNLALYRKYRPRTFSEVIGQQSVTSSLSRQVEGGKISHAYIFTGTRGTGKTTCAKILARAICCQNPQGGSPCNECPACRSVLSGSAMDITEIDAASNNGVDNIRELRQEAMYAPTELKYRVYIIDEVHMLSPGAFNALLKTLEEPPEHVVFILATTEIHKVPQTILSRCQRYDFRRIPSELMAAALEDIAKKEGFLLDHDAADMLAVMGDGSMRDSISLLDRAWSGSFHVTKDRVAEALGLAREQEIESIFKAVLRCDAPAAVEGFTSCYMAGRDIVSIFDDLLSLVRDLYLYKATQKTDFLMSRWRELAPALSESCSLKRLEGFSEDLSFFLSRVTRNSARRLDGEMCLIKMALPQKRAVYKAEPEDAPEERPQAEKAGNLPDDLPPWETEGEGPSEKAVQGTAERSEYAPPENDAEGFEKLRKAIDGKVNSAVRAYLRTAGAEHRVGGLYITVPEEGLIFIGKKDVLSILEEEGKKVGYAFVKVEKKSPPPKDPIEQLKDRAIGLGVNVKIK